MALLYLGKGRRVDRQELVCGREVQGTPRSRRTYIMAVATGVRGRLGC